MATEIHYVGLTSGRFQRVTLDSDGISTRASTGGRVRAFATPRGLDYIIACSSGSKAKHELPPTRAGELCGTKTLEVDENALKRHWAKLDAMEAELS